jgi:Outer membrane protein beta-barrel domain
MPGKSLWVVVLFMAVFLASAAAQDEKNEIGGAIGRVFISDQGIQADIPNPTIHSGKGLTFEGEYARRIFVTPIFGISAEAVVAYNKGVKLNAGEYPSSVVPEGYKELFVTPAARVNLFPTTAVSPWVSIGGGITHFTENSQLLFGGANPGKNTTSGTLEAGVGLDVRVWKRLSMRGGMRDFWSGVPDYPLAPTGKTRQHNYFVFGGLFWRF